MTSEDYFLRLTAGGTFNRALTIFARRYDIFLLVMGIIFVPLVAAAISMVNIAGSSVHTLMDAMDTSNRLLQQTYGAYSSSSSSSSATAVDPQAIANELLEKSSVFMAQFFLEMVIYVVVALAGRAAMSYAVGLMYARRDPHLCECLKVGFRKWCDLFCASMMVGFGVGLGNVLTQMIAALVTRISIYLSFISFAILLAWLVCVIFVYVSVIILVPVIMIENLGPIDGIKRTWALSWNNECYIFCTLFCFMIVSQLAVALLAAIIVSIAGTNALFTVWGVVILTLPALVFLPIATILETVVYLNIRVQREAMNLTVLNNDLDGKEMVLEYSMDKSSKYTPVAKAEPV